MDAALGIAQPKPGHWEGKNGVSFDLTADNKVSAFKITIPIGANECNLAMTKDFPIDAKGTFIIGELMPDGTLSSNSLYGIFTSATSVNGEFSKTIICGSTIQFFIVDTPWSAEWKTP